LVPNVPYETLGSAVETREVLKRILLISLYHPALSPGGAQQACYNLFKGLQGLACEPILLASVERHIWPSLFKPNVTITGLDDRKNEFLFLSRGYDHIFPRNREPASLEKFEAFLSGVQPDVIHFHCFISFGLEYFVSARRYLDKIGGPLIFTLHDFLAMCQSEAQMVRTFDKSLCEYASSFRSMLPGPATGAFQHANYVDQASPQFR
jgi:glycosyltransferase involved in cell wall biosynthesis